MSAFNLHWKQKMLALNPSVLASFKYETSFEKVTIDAKPTNWHQSNLQLGTETTTGLYLAIFEHQTQA